MWDYAQLSVRASDAGGVLAYDNSLIEKGIVQGKRSMYQWLGIAFACGGFVVIGVNKIRLYFKKRKCMREELVRGSTDQITNSVCLQLSRSKLKVNNVYIINGK